MFKETKVFSSFSVNDIEEAQEFYEDILKIETSRDEMGMLTLHLPGAGEVIVYPKGGQHTPASFTVLNFLVENIDAAVKMLNSAGIQMEKYEGNISTDEKGISRGDKAKGHPSIAWFKDPAGNILSVLQPAEANT